MSETNHTTARITRPTRKISRKTARQPPVSESRPGSATAARDELGHEDGDRDRQPAPVAADDTRPGDPRVATGGRVESEPPGEGAERRSVLLVQSVARALSHELVDEQDRMSRALELRVGQRSGQRGEQLVPQVAERRVLVERRAEEGRREAVEPLRRA